MKKLFVFLFVLTTHLTFWVNAQQAVVGQPLPAWKEGYLDLHHINTGGIYESYGRGWLIQPKPEDEKELKTGKWNTLKIKVVGDEVTTWLNGRRMVYLKDEKIGNGEGFIALQIHDGGGIKVRWKDIMIKEL